MAVDTTTTQAELQDAIDYLGGIKSSLGKDSRTINFEYGKSAVVVDSLEETAEEEAENDYKTNEFTTKFLERFLILNGSDNLMSSNNSANSYVLNLFGGGGSTQQYMTNIFNLIA
jgi:hypothetical protein